MTAQLKESHFTYICTIYLTHISHGSDCSGRVPTLKQEVKSPANSILRNRIVISFCSMDTQKGGTSSNMSKNYKKVPLVRKFLYTQGQKYTYSHLDYYFSDVEISKNVLPLPLIFLVLIMTDYSWCQHCANRKMVGLTALIALINTQYIRKIQGAQFKSEKEHIFMNLGMSLGANQKQMQISRSLVQTSVCKYKLLGGVATL